MSQVIDQPAEPVGDEATPPPAPIADDIRFRWFDNVPLLRRIPQEYRSLLWQLLMLAGPVAAEHSLHIIVGVNDTALANYLPKHAPEAASAVGNVGYIFWFVGLFCGAIGTGSTAVIAREIGARHRRRANSACGQSMLFAMLLGVALGIAMYCFARPIANVMGLEGVAYDYAYSYLRMLCPAVPFVTVMFVANSCLRGAGDTLTPAIAFIVVDVVNVICSWGFTWGWFGLPAMGFEGIAVGTVIAYIAGGVLLIIVMLRGRGGIRLHLHRLRPHVNDMRRILRIGVPSGVTDAINWLANFAMIRVVNHTAPLNIATAAHINAVRIESLSYMIGFAIAIAVSTMVGQSLGMRDPKRAERSAYLAYAVGGGFMAVVGVLFIFFAWVPCHIMIRDPQVRDLAARCLQITGFCQAGFAAAIIFGGALRGAGDTVAVMLITSVSIVGIRFCGAMIAGHLHQPLTVIWIILASDLFVRGALIYGRFAHGGWKRVRV